MHHHPHYQESSSLCQSSLCPVLVSFPVLSRIKPQIPHLVVPFRQFLQVSALQPYSPQNPSTQWFPSKIQKVSFLSSSTLFVYSQQIHKSTRISLLSFLTSHPWSASFMALDYDGIWSSSIPKLSFLINGHVLGKCFRCCLSWTNPWISPLTIQYKYPQPFLFIIITKNHIHSLFFPIFFYYPLLSYSIISFIWNYFYHFNLFKVKKLKNNQTLFLIFFSHLKNLSFKLSSLPTTSVLTATIFV